MDDGTPTLEVGFAIDTGGSFEELTRLDGLIDSATANAVAEFAKVEQAVKGITFGAATASITSFGSAATREAQNAARELARVEKSGESLVRSLEKQADAFGKTREELRGIKAEAAAAAAESQGLTELAQRIRAAESSLYDQEFAAARRARQVAEEAAEQRIAAEAAAVRALAEAQHAVVMQLAERANLEAAISRSTGVGQVRATDAGASFSALSAKAAQDETRAAQSAAAAEKQLADEHARLAALVRGSHDAQVADAEAAERMREATDPLYAATKRLNAEIAESTRLYHTGATAPEEYARQQDVLRQRLAGVTQQHEAMAVAGGKNAFALKEVALQLPDIFEGLTTGQKPMQVFIQQGSQIAQIGMLAEGGLKALAAQAALAALPFTPLIIAAGALFGAFKLFQAQVKQDGDLTRYRDGLGLTHKEMLELSDGVDKAGDKIARLSDVTVTAGDVMSGLWKTIQQNAGNSSGWDTFKDGAVTAFRKVLDGWNVVSASITAAIYGTANAAKVIWNNFATSVGDVFYSAVNISIDAMNKLVKAGTDILNGFIHGANLIPGIKIGDVAAPQIQNVANPYAGASSRDAAADAAKAVSDGYKKAYADARKEDDAFWKQVGVNARQSAKDRMAEEAAAIKASRTPKVDHHAEELAREAAAVEAQIKNLYKLADAYGVSGAAALIAEAREKAESSAIKKRGDIEEMVARQIRLAIAQRVADGEKATLTLNRQAGVEEQVNAMVAAGLVPAARASELIQQRIALLPLLDAQQAAMQANDKKGYDAATKAISDETAAQNRLNEANRQAWLLSASSAASDELETLQAELRLINATDAARVHELATIKARQDALAHGLTPGTDQFDSHVKGQVAVADAQQHLREQTSQLNGDLRQTAELADSVADSMSKAFGRVGDAIGGVISILGNYGERQQAIADKINSGNLTAAQGAKAYGNLQITSLIGITDAAKGLFKEHSRGYEAMEAAEKALTIVQLARTAVDVAGGAARMFASLGPFAFPAVAAMLGVMASLGFSGGGSSTSAADFSKGNTGTGTVLGDSTAQSDSLKRSIDQLKDIDTTTSVFAREMAASLKSIDSQIGNLATVLVRSGNLSADSSVTEGFKPAVSSGLISTVLGGPILSHIPIIGGIVNGIAGVISSLFGSKTTIVGSGIIGGNQTIGDIINNGFDANTYTDVQKKKKFFGITTSTKYKTELGGSIDSSVSDQFALILKSFNDAIVSAAGPLGASTSDITKKLSSFVFSLGKIDLKDLTGEQIQDKLEAVFGAAADSMADAAFPGIERFQKVGEGAFETLVRVASTVDAVTNSLKELGQSATGLSIDAKMGIADQFDSVSDMQSAVDSYFTTFYSKTEQAAARTAQLSDVFASLGLTLPSSLDEYRKLVEAQDLSTAAGQSTYATLLKLAPAFADLQTSLLGAKSAADIASERQDLQRQLLEDQGNTAAVRAMDLAKLDESNRALQEQIWAVEDAKTAADAAQQLSDAWKSVGDSIADEIARIKGLSDDTGGSFSSLMGQFNAATIAAQGGDQDAAKSLPGLSQSLLSAAQDAATSRQELDRIRAQVLASLTTTQAIINGLVGAGTASATGSVVGGVAGVATDRLPGATTTNDMGSATITAGGDASNNDAILQRLADLGDQIDKLRTDNNAGHAATAGNTGAIKRKLDDVTAASGGDAISVAA